MLSNLDDIYIFKYTLRNKTSKPLINLFEGMFCHVPCKYYENIWLFRPYTHQVYSQFSLPNKFGSGMAKYTHQPYGGGKGCRCMGKKYYELANLGSEGTCT